MNSTSFYISILIDFLFITHTSTYIYYLIYTYQPILIAFPCGDSEDWTHDLLLAKQALSQLSYIPDTPKSSIIGYSWTYTTAKISIII